MSGLALAFGRRGIVLGQLLDDIRVVDSVC